VLPLCCNECEWEAAAAAQKDGLRASIPQTGRMIYKQRVK